MLVLLGVRSCAATAEILYREGGHLLLEINLLSRLHEDRKKKSGCVQTAWDGTLPLEREMGAIISTRV